MKTENTNDKNKIYSGEWWIPGKKSKKAHGTLHVPTDGIITLKLHGNLGSNENINPKIIYGSAISGKDFTLVDCADAKFISGLSGYYRSLTPSIVLEGAHVSDLSKQLFTNLTLDFTHLEEWCAEQTIFGEGFLNDDYKIVRQEYRAVPIKSPPIHLASIKTDLVISHLIEPRYTKFRELVLMDTVTLNFSVKKAKSYEWFEDLVEKFQNMLAFFTGKPVFPQRMILKSKAVKSSKKKFAAKRIVVYAKQSEEYTDEPFDADEVLIPYRVIKPIAAQVIDKFLTDYEPLQPVVELFLGNIYQPPYLAQNRFINLIQALEAFLRRKRPGSYLTDETHKEFSSRLAEAYKTIVGEMRDELRNSKLTSSAPAKDSEELKNLHGKLKGGLPYINEKSLRSRIEKAFKSLSPDERRLVSDDVQKLISKAVETRNYFTHFSEELKAKKLTGLELYQASEGLKILIILLLLDTLGVDEKTRIKLIAENPALQFKRAYKLTFK